MILEESNEVTVDEKLTSKYAKALKNAAFLTVVAELEDFTAKDVVACFAVEANSSAPRIGVLKHLAALYGKMNDKLVAEYLGTVEPVKGRRTQPAPKRRGRPPKNGTVAEA